MLETIITSTNGESFTLFNAILIIISSIVLGLIISLAYMKTHKKEGYATGFTITLIMLPVIIAIIILLVGNNVARAFSLAGAFSIIRFRSAPGDPKDITYVFFTLAVGLTCGMGYIGYAFIFTLILCALTLILDSTKFAMPKTKTSKLKITIPEDLNYDGIFDDILNKYTNSWHVETIKTRDFGSLFEIHYIIHMKLDANQKKFIDELRCKNGNLNISLNFAGFEEKVYN
ncbi:DUF4956 domain-containing protein [Clostridium tertium]|jgi:Domain of unknown function (DUF4956)|uniref:DUF4956 domain-containing protein n=1 Tax=Clostridium TaxID=1485 RepID=UPI001DFFFC95|nr:MULTISPECIES: DUF4956 domain-containing protein [Clostridium]MBS5307564.1 DUF4956 domain-containing protein [Clostridium sp.]MDB1923126.1 DUF4956 domain-containing protein [Clostridium tertium]MDB1926732.1 DUF4956 domain-containing protein [Clostridium tertium]MDB1930195.1 DUF4956 domain-containing protein [Clostridium tertium]MDB1931864.1 DUF4956 domain-containing protein [Clostridium tertium]